MSMRRRKFLLTAAASTLAGAFLLRPSDRGAPHDAYFAKLNALLRARGPGRPVLVIDAERLDRNCKRLRDSVGAGKQLRIVAKSLPSPELIRYVLAHTHSTRVMSFHQPFLSALARELPQVDVLMGKPMPVRAAETFYRTLDRTSGFEPVRQLRWLVDSHERLLQYQQLARTLGTTLATSLELDVGLHRGGLRQTAELDALLATIAGDPQHLRFSGFMGYDAHVGKIPALLESRETSLAKANAVYTGFIARARARFPALVSEGVVYNGAGSPTFRLHREHSPLNEVSVGSALLKPGDFELPLLHDFEPAAFIATPVLKALDGLHLPGPAGVGESWALWDPNRRRTFFVYGGRWLANYASPAGLRDNDLYGKSSNQSIVNASRGVQLRVDDYVFLRPTQSEAVLLQFGDLAIVRGEQIEHYWPVLTPEHEHA